MQAIDIYKKMKKTIIPIIIVCAALVAITLFVFYPTTGSDNNALAEDTALEHAQQHSDPNYVCPMHPQVTDNKASSCPICGMDLELREPAVSHSSSPHSSEASAVYISPAMKNNLGVRLQHVETGSVSEQVYASGFVERVADAQQKLINSKVVGRLHERVVSAGQWVESDDVLLRIAVDSYQETLAQYLETMETGQIEKALQLRKELIAMGVGDEVLAGFNDDKPLSKYLEIVAPFSGEVSWLLHAEAGSEIKLAQELVEISAPALAEVDLRSYSRLTRGVRIGHTGNLSVAHLPGRTWPGRVVEIIHNRAGFFSSLRFHVEIPAGLLEPGAFAGAYVNAGTAHQVLRIPASAVIYDENSIRVIRLADNESFEVVEITIGFEGHQWVEVQAGLEPGDHVVVRGQFLIDSEATLQAGFKRLSEQ